MPEKNPPVALAKVLPFRARRDYSQEAPIPVGLPTAAPAIIRSGPVTKLAKPLGVPLHFFVGSGFAGKSFTAKFLIDRAIAAGKTLSVAELDPSKRELVRTYGADAVMQPTEWDAATQQEVPTRDPAKAFAWLVRYLEWHGQQQPIPPGLVEFGGGGDAPLLRLVDETPNLNATMEAGGVSPVLWHFLTSRVEDLGTLKAMEDRGFRPKATVLVFSDAFVRDADPEDVFGRVWAHPVYRAALERGAVSIRIPELVHEFASEVDHGMRFSAYEDHLKRLGMGGLRMRAMSGWMQRMEAALAPLEDCLL